MSAHASFVPDPSWPTIAQLAKQRWGEPNKALSSRDDIRYGAKGSKSVKPSDNTWFDHEANDGGGYVEMHEATIGPLPQPERKPKHKTNGEVPPWEDIATTYPYPDADGTLILEVVRTISGEPRFRQRRPTGNGKWIWSTKEIPAADRPLYRLPGLRASGDATVWITEGEKDADSLHDVGLIATTNVGGAGKWHPAYASEFTGKHAVVLPDNDKVGRDHADAVAQSLVGVAASVKVLALPGLREKGDVSDWLDAGGTVEELERVAREAPKWREPEADRPLGRILSGADFIARHVPPVWLIDGIVQRSRLYACTSLTGHGKTAVWLFNACMIHAGRMIGHLESFQGNVLILAGENPSDLEARMIGMAKAYNLPLDRLPYVLPGGFPLTEEEADALKRDIAGLGVPLALIVGDTASSFFPGDDENSNVQAGTYARTLRTFTECEGRPAIMALSHPTKGASRESLLPRGGGAFLNELDGNLVLWSASQGEVTELHWCGKIRGPDFSPIGYRLRQVPTGLIDERDRPEMTIVAEPMSEEAVADHSKQVLANEDVVLRALRDRPGLSWAQIARDAGWLDENDQPMKWHVQRAIRSLADDKLIHRPRKGAPWVLTEKGEKALEKDSL